MRKLIMMQALLVVLLMPVSVRAQNGIHLSSVSVDIWPEYDQPAVLVIYHIVLSSDVILPATLTLHVPADLLNSPSAPYEYIEQEHSAALTIVANSPQVQFEYYEPLVKNGTARHIVFKWAGDYATGVLETNFLQPFGAQAITISPAPMKTGSGQAGLTNHQNRVVQLGAGQSYTLTIDYQRQTDDVSISNLPVQAASTPGPDTPGRVSMTGILPWVLAGIGALLIVSGVAGFVVWQRGGQKSAVRRRQTPHPERGEAESIYCQQCGKRARPGDVFCRTCGTRLRRGSAD